MSEEQETQSPSTSATKAAIRELQAKLKRLEDTTVLGAPINDSRSDMLSLEGLQEANPDRHFRRVNVGDRNKANRRVAQGYVAVSEDECREAGVRNEIGETRVMSIPREVHEERVAEQQAENRRRLRAHQADVRQAAEAVARELRDKHGLDVPLDRLLVDE